MSPFEGKVALVTGGTTGIGRATAIALVSEITMRSKQQGEKAHGT